ncbi:NlpB/DapX lipoprotein domain protein, partial [Burkholderia sp. SIMBA_057]
LALADSRAQGGGTQSAEVSPAGAQTAPGAATAGAKSAAAATAAQNVALSAQQPVRDPDSANAPSQLASSELTLGEPYDRAW